VAQGDFDCIHDHVGRDEAQAGAIVWAWRIQAGLTIEAGR